MAGSLGRGEGGAGVPAHPGDHGAGWESARSPCRGVHAAMLARELQQLPPPSPNVPLPPPPTRGDRCAAQGQPPTAGHTLCSREFNFSSEQRAPVARPARLVENPNDQWIWGPGAGTGGRPQGSMPFHLPSLVQAPWTAGAQSHGQHGADRTSELTVLLRQGPWTWPGKGRPKGGTPQAAGADRGLGLAEERP